MTIITRYPEKAAWPALLQRPGANFDDILPAVETIIKQVQTGGNAALNACTQQFDGVLPEYLEVQPGEWAAADEIDDTLKTAIHTAIQNITQFHQAQVETPVVIETMPGVRCWRKAVPIEKAGLYIPGGSAPLFSTLLMLAIPARIAGVKEIIVCTPPNANGAVHPAILYAARETGVTRIIKAGGAQAVAAMAYGTETIPAVYKIFGPGNRYVTAAKMWLTARGMAVDMPAGPSELAILADETCTPAYLAADLLSQAEHGGDSQVILVSTSEAVLDAVNDAIHQQLPLLPRSKTAAAALQNSRFILVNHLAEGMELLNEYAPEHLIIACHEPEIWAERVVNAGSVFLGNYAPESAGDYASGTNHTLPTSGFAKAYSGVSVDSFVKKITFQQLSRTGLQHIGPSVMTMAGAEGLFGHANAVALRMNDILPADEQNETNYEL